MRRRVLKLLFSVTVALLLGKCAQTGAPMPPSLELPKPVTDLKAVRKGDKVNLTWTMPSRTSDGQKVRYVGPTRICRSLRAAMTTCGTVVGEVAAPPPAVAGGRPEIGSYTDALPPDALSQNPDVAAIYAVEVLNTSNRSAGLSNQAQVSVLKLAPPPTELHAEVKANGVELSWVCPVIQQSALEYRLHIYRRTENSGEATRVGDLPLQECSGTFLDQSFEWEQTYFYRAAVVAELSQPAAELEGDETPEVKVLTHDMFAPAVPAGLQAVFSGVGQQPFVDLTWAPGTESDMAGYNVYRHEEGAEPAKINLEPIKTPTYRDSNVQSNRKYFYSVSALDLRGNESARSEEASEQVP